MTEDRRIRPPAKHEKLIDELTNEGLFQTKAAAMMFAAALGHRFTGRKPVDKPGNGVRWHIFDNNQDAAFVYAIAMSDVDSLSALDPTQSDFDDPTAVFEEYIAGGFDYLESNLLKRPGSRLDNLLAIIQEARIAQHESPAGLEGIDSSTLRLLGDFDD